MQPATSVLRSVMCDWRMTQTPTVSGQLCHRGVKWTPRHPINLPLQLVRCKKILKGEMGSYLSHPNTQSQLHNDAVSLVTEETWACVVCYTN